MGAAVHSKHEEITGLQVRARLEPVPEGHASLRAYVPVNGYLPLFCIMAERGGGILAGADGAIAPIAPGTIAYVVNNVRVTWIPLGQDCLYAGEH